MSDRQKYALNGVYFFENAREHIERNDFPRIPIGTIGGVGGWRLKLRQKNIDNETYNYPIISTRERKTKTICRSYICIVKNDGLLVYHKNARFNLKYDEGPIGRRISVDELLNEKNRYMRNGGIKVEYGIQIEGFLSPDNIWTFNFHDPLFNCEKEGKMITFVEWDWESFTVHKSWFYCHKQLLTFHSSYFNSNPKYNLSEERGKNTLNFDTFLQIAHGVRGKVRMNMFNEVLLEARRYKLSNVVQLVDQELLSKTSDDKMLIPAAIKHELHHYLARLLRERGSAKGLAKELKEIDLEKMKGETMKKLVRFFFNH